MYVGIRFVLLRINFEEKCQKRFLFKIDLDNMGEEKVIWSIVALVLSKKGKATYVKFEDEFSFKVDRM